MNRKIRIIWLPIFLLIFTICRSLYPSTFDDFLSDKKGIYSDDTNHTEGWTGPNGEKWDWDASSETFRLIYTRYSYRFIKPNKNKVEVSAIKILGIWIDTTKDKIE